MANRSYLYTCDELPGGRSFHARGLSEYGWDIPIVHKLMVANEPRVVRSAIWNHDIAIVARRDGAFERALAFLAKVGEGKLAKRDEFDEALADMTGFLETTPPSKYVLLEAGEILDIQGDLADGVKRLAAELPELAAKVDRAIAGNEAKWLATLRAKWQDRANPGWWSDVLYFSFKAPTTIATKEQPAARATKRA